MTENRIFRERIKYFLLGMLVVIGMIFLTGAKKNDTVVIDNGRYQISAWGDGRAHGAFVVDTISGETKIVYRYKELGNSKSKERNYLNEPFSSIR
jgi:hypothetical protein